MKNWKRITFAIFVLIGGTMSFGYWSINQFDSALDDISAPYFENTHLAYLSFKQNTRLPSASPEVVGEVAAFTDPALPSASPEIAEELPTFTDQKLSFTFLQEDTKVYIGCTYPIYWQPPTMISSLEAALIDAGSRKAALPERSGLAKENTIEKESQNLNWKVGFVWPGTYYIEVSKINGIETEFRSKAFEISKMPEGIDEC